MKESRYCGHVNVPRTRLSGSWLSWPKPASLFAVETD